MFKLPSLGLLFVLNLFFSTSVSAQEKNPSGIKNSNPIFSHQYTFQNDNSYYFIDTLFDDLQEYHQWNNANKDLFGFSVLGSMGAALNPLSLDQELDLWSYFDFKGYDSYFLNQNHIKYYNVKSPLTQANYWMGYDIGQKFQILHTQNINEDWNFLIDYSRLNNLGFYSNSLSKQVNFLASSKYESDDGPYKAYFYFLNQNLETEENGGIANDSIFEQNLESNRTLYLMNLDGDNRTMRNRELFVNQELNFNAWARDSIKDTVRENSVWFGHELKYSRRSDTYNGLANGVYYQDYFNGTDTYMDSSFYSSVSNTLYLRTKLESWNDFELKVGAKNLIYNYGTDNFSFGGAALGLVGDLYGRVGRLQIQSNLDYILTGNLRESLDFRSSGKLRIAKKGYVKVSYNLNSRFPDFFKQMNYSNNFIWANDFRKVNTNELSLLLRWNGNNGLKVSNTIIANHVYFDNQIRPQQYEPLLNLLKLEFDQNFKFWNLLHFDNKIVYQVIDKKGEEVLPLPQIISRNSLYFEFSLFKNALKCLVGSEVKYFSGYNSPSFVPAIGDFAVQDELEIGNYPSIDVFANFKISSAIVFFKFEHVNQGLNSYSYYAAPNYPFPDRIFRVGISWRFFN